MKRLRPVFSLWTLSFLLSLSFCFGQDSLYNYPNWEISVNTLPLFRRPTIPSFPTTPSVLVRYHSQKSNLGVRLQIGTRVALKEGNDVSESNFFLRPGVDIRYPLSKKSTIHYGADLIYKQRRELLYLLSIQQNTVTRIYEHTARSRTTGAGLFLGYRFMFLKNLSFYIETGINFEREKVFVNNINAGGLISVNGEIIPGPVFISGGRYARSALLDLVPLQAINISLHL